MQSRKGSGRKRNGRWWQLNYLGLLIGLLFFCISLTPSLLPLTPMFQGLLAGLGFAVGYANGVILSWVIRRLAKKELPTKYKRIAWVGILLALPLLSCAYIIWAAGWQNSVRLIMGQPPLVGQHLFVTLLIAITIAALLITAGRLIAYSIRRINSLVGHGVPTRWSAAISICIVVGMLYLLYSGVFVTAFVQVTNDIYRGANDQTNEGVVRPTTTLRSGGLESSVSWESLGRQGRNFIGRGPTVEQISAVTQQPATEPIRVYAGLQSADSATSRAALAVQELKRTGAFQRKVLTVMTTTGTGWLEPQATDSLEYMWNGDTALAAIQYSYLPSWVSFLVDRQNATEAGQALFDAVYREWNQLPVDARPKLIVYGLSLGAYGSQSAFSGVDDLQNRTDGALFVGPPSQSQLWQRFTRERDAGSPEWQPQYEGGQAVRFAASAQDTMNNQSEWTPPRILYMQHASDPVVWWNVDLIFHKPDWLSPRGPDISPNMKWYPFITFSQTTADQLFATSVPAGHGHNYSDAIVAGWQAVTQPPDWTPEQSAALQTIIDGYKIE